MFRIKIDKGYKTKYYSSQAMFEMWWAKHTTDYGRYYDITAETIQGDGWVQIREYKKTYSDEDKAKDALQRKNDVNSFVTKLRPFNATHACCSKPGDPCIGDHIEKCTCTGAHYNNKCDCNGDG